MLRPLALFGLVAGCGGPPAPLTPPGTVDRLLRVGVDLEAEEARVVSALDEAGFVVVRRVQGETFRAIQLAHADGRRAVRVISQRGVVIAFDSAEDEALGPRREALEVLDVGASDLDRDGAEEVALRWRDRGSERACVRLVRIDDIGQPVEVESDAVRVRPDLCPEEVVDADDDGRFELEVRLDWPELAMGDSRPRVPVWLSAQGGGWTLDEPPESALAHEEERRRVALEAARAELDVSRCHRLGLELAALAHLAGAPRGAQLARYDAALVGLVLSRGQEATIERARLHVQRGWR